MGPSRIFHKNRSSHSLLSSQDVSEKGRYQASPAESPLHSPGFPPPSQHDDGEEEEEEEQDQTYGHPYRAEDAARFYHLGHPTRSQSHRSPNQINTNVPQPTIHLVGPAHSTPNSAVDEPPPDSYYRQGPTPTAPPHKEDRKKRRFFGLGGSSKDSANNPAPAKLGRSISVRRREHLPDTFHESGPPSAQSDWPSTHASPTDDYDQDEEAAAVGPTHPHLREKDPLRSPGLPPSITHQEHSHRRTTTSPEAGRRIDLDRQASADSYWARTSANVHHHGHTASAQQTPTSYHPSPSSATSAVSGQPFHHKSANDNLHQHWQEQIPSRPSSQQSLEPPPPGQYPRGHDSHHTRGSSSQASSLSHHTQSSMGPPSQPQGPNRRPSEQLQHPPGDQGREGGYQPYAQNAQGGSVLPSNAPPQYSSQLAPQAYRGNPAPSPMQSNSHEQGRSTPPPSRSRDDLSSIDHKEIQQARDELRSLEEKYRKVKKYYFDKDAQVQQLQNTLAHQRLAQSRTSLDDNEYANRFGRLDGAINNLAFNIRRDWRQVPPWLAPHVNRDATTSPTKEMTAVGRAAISRWLVDELFDRYFHPGLESALSAHLKIIEKNLRRFAAPTPTDEEKDALLAKISNWRLSSLDGLSEILASPLATENRTVLTEMLVEKLVASLAMMLKEPTPPGLDNSVSTIVELAVGIAANLPQESRDVFVEYITPGQLISESYMKIETGLPALTNPGEGPAEGETASLTSKQTEETDSIDNRENGNSNGHAAAEEKESSPGQQGQAAGKKKGGMFGSFIGGGTTGNKKGSVASTASSVGQLQGQNAPGGGAGNERKDDRVRFSTFFAVEVRGRSVLVKAPVYVKE